MAGLSFDHPWAFAFGILGNLISFAVYLAPIPTFYRIYKKKSTEEFQSEPYVIALFSSMLWIFYALIKTDGYLLITINSVGCVIESVYIVMFLVYAQKKVKIYAVKIFLLLDVLLFSSIVLSTLLLTKGDKRVKVLGWMCVGFAVSVFAAPLSIIRQVVRTKSVEFMPFSLSFTLTLSAIAWFSYGLFTKDIYVAIPNVLGFTFGVAQMVLYIIYKDAKELAAKDEEKLPELSTVSLIKLNEIKVTPHVIHEAEVDANDPEDPEHKATNDTENININIVVEENKTENEELELKKGRDAVETTSPK